MASLNALHPTPEQIAQHLAHHKAGEPVYMLNLLKFKDRATYNDSDVNPENDVSGAQAYARYGAAFGDVARAVDSGFEAGFAGEVSTLLIGQIGEGTDWDMVAIAKYSSAQMMIDCVSSPAYRKIHYHRKAGLEGQILITCSAAKVF